MENLESLEYGETYHIYNKAVGGVLLFISPIDYQYFLKKLERFILPIADIYAYCLIPNHFHLLLRIKEYVEISNTKKTEFDTKWIIQVFSNFFISYSRSYNNVYNRQGRLFLQPFKRIKVDDEDYLTDLVAYIHRNPIRHGIATDFTDWKYSSYRSYLSNKKTRIVKEEILSYFDSLEDFIIFHNENKNKNIDYYLE